MKIGTMALIAAAGLAGVANAAPSITALSTFGTNGWLAPGTSTFLGTGNLERGMAYNRATGNLILVSRNGGVNARIIDGQTGVDEGGLAGAGTLSGGTFAGSKVGVTDDGQIYVANLTTNASTSAIKIYRWGSETDAGPTTWFNSTTSHVARYGDNIDVTGSGSNVRVVMGAQGANATTGYGYTVFSGGAGGGSAQVVDTYDVLPNSVGSTAPRSKFRLGITFGKTSNDVWGKVSSDGLYRSTYGAGNVATMLSGPTGQALTSAGESNMDFVTIGGRDYLAVLDSFSGGGTLGARVYIYDVTDPTTPVSLFAFGAWTSGNAALAANGNASGSVAWGAIDNINQTATLYAMNSNQGIQAFTFTVPAPGTAALMGLAGLVATRRRR
ncbi:MAG: hypothetical protein SFY96_01365 [Planctomycetota bacterium]|nr:hypothetical protein [Planctomycetota bacterium]